MKRMDIAGYGLAILLCLAGFSAPAQAQLTAMVGHCIDQQGKPIAGATIVFQELDVRQQYRVKTNKQGFYQHYGLPLGLYKVSLLGPDGKVVAAVNDVQTQMAVTKTLNFDLRKMLHAAPAAPPPPPGGIALGAVNAQSAAAVRELQQRQKLVAQINALVAQHDAAVKAGQWPQAIASIQQAIALDPRLGVLHADLGDAYSGARQYPQALAAYQQAIALEPKNADYLIGLGNAQLGAGHPHAAMQAFRQAGGVNPSQAKIALFNEGVKFYNQSRMHLAAGALGAALQLDPSLAEAWFLRGMALLSSATVDPKTGQIVAPPAAAAALQKYLQLQPQGPHAATVRATLQALSGKVQTRYKAH